MPRRERGQVITFYSYKGGAGRTMAVANCACLLARGEVVPVGKEERPQKVLAIDWDLEAPGLHQFLRPAQGEEASGQLGVIDLFERVEALIEERSSQQRADAKTVDKLVRDLPLADYTRPTEVPSLWLMPAGRLPDPDYHRRVTAFRWEKLFDRAPTLFPALARRLAEEFDFILIDSRTGMSDTSGICTTLMPEKLVVVFTPNAQSLGGLRDLVESATQYRSRSDDWRPLTVFPLASRIDFERPVLEKRWRSGDSKVEIPIPGGGYQRLFEETLRAAFDLGSCDLGDYFARVKLPHVSDYSYGEPLVVELESEELERDATLTLSESYRQFTLRLVSLAGPWENLETLAAKRSVESLQRQARESEEPAVTEQRLSRALEIHAQSPGVVNPSLAEDLETLAHVRLGAGKAADAVRLLEGARQVVERAYGAEHPRVADVLAARAQALEQAGELEEALAAAGRARDLRRRALGEEHLSSAESYGLLGRLQAQAGQLEESAVAHQKRLEICRALLGARHPETAAALLAVADLERRRDRPEAARKALRQVEEILSAEGFPALDKARLGGEIAQLHADLGDESEADRLRSELAPQVKRIQPGRREEQIRPRTRIFISYSHRDREWKERLVGHLSPLAEKGRLELWDDRAIRAGEEWYSSIDEALAASKVALLLVSPDYLASDFIRRDELPRLLDRQRREGLTVLAILIRPSVWRQVEWLSRLQLLPAGGQPLSALEEPEAEECLAGIARQLAELAAAAAARPEAEELRRRYLEELMRRVGSLSLGGVDPAAALDEANPRLELQAIYTALLTTGSQEPEIRAALRQTRSDPRGEPRRRSALEQANHHPRLVLLGDPGSGKSTFVNFLALCLAGEALGHREANLEALTRRPPGDRAEEKEKEKEKPREAWDHGTLLPIRVVLRELAARADLAHASKRHGGPLWHFLEQELAACDLAGFRAPLEAELRERGALLLLDGLDEVPAAERLRQRIQQVIADFARRYPKCRILVTCRTYAYQRQDWQLEGFADAVLAPFSAAQIEAFVDRWYAHIGQLRGLDPADAAGRAQLLKQAIAGNERLAAFAERPLLLALMASLHAWRGGSLPEQRERLYADAVDLLLDAWERQRMILGPDGRPLLIQPSLAEWLRVDRREVRAALDRLAFEVHEAHGDLEGAADIPEEHLANALMSLSENPELHQDRLVEYLRDRAGLLVARGVGVYAFPHRTFQEYLAACWLTEEEFPDQVADLARRDPNRWREVVLLAGAKAARGAASTVWQLAEALCWRGPEAAEGQAADPWGALLAGQLLLESADLGRISGRNVERLERYRRWQVDILTGGDLPALERAGAGRVLARLGDPREAVTSIAGMEMCRVPPGPFWWGGGYDYVESKKTPWEERQVAGRYWISRFPVTQAQYREFCTAGGYREEGYWAEARKAGVWDGGKVTDWVGDVSMDAPEAYREPLSLPNHPVVGVTWYEALAFTRWLTERLRAQGLPADWKVRLPSEEEWEKAARGGLRLPADPPVFTRVDALIPTATEAKDAAPAAVENPSPRRQYPWGEEISPEQANYDDTGVGATSAIGCFPSGRSPYGCEELSGNVWEWCRDLRRGEAGDRDAGVALRGGSWALPAQDLAAALRGRGWAWSRLQVIGFRVVLSSSSEHP